ncbi:hypothetical protein GYB22_10525 [bacterium]|nr:hypothetical protein [bacterium]
MQLRSIVLILSVISFCSLNHVKAQNSWLGVSPVKIGFGVQSWSIDPVYNNFRYNQVDADPNVGSPLDESNNNTFTNIRVPVVFENIGRHLHTSFSATGAVDILIDLLKGYPTIGDDDTEARRLELIPTELAVGGWFADRIGLYAGAQYAYSRVILKDDDVPDELMLGGHIRGFHGLVMINAGPMLFKATAYQDWVRHSKRASKGTAQTLDLEAYLSLNPERTVGLWLGTRFRTIRSTGPEGMPTEDWVYSGIDNQKYANSSFDFPDIRGNAFYLRGGFYFSLY